MSILIEPESRLAPGRRRLSENALSQTIQSRDYAGLPQTVQSPMALLAAVKKARVPLGLSSPLLDLADLLFSFTKPADWQEGRRPIVWPSNRFLADQMGITVSAVQKRIRLGVHRGLFVMKDAPNGQRRGQRDKSGLLVETECFGFDLTPLAVRYSEFQTLSQAHAEAYRARRAMRRKGYMLKTALLQALELAREEGQWSAWWSEFADRCEPIFNALAVSEDLSHLAALIDRLEDMRHLAEVTLVKDRSYSSDSHPMGGNNATLNNSTTENPISINVESQPEKSSRIPSSLSEPPSARIEIPESEVEELYLPSVVIQAVPELAQYCHPYRTGWNELSNLAAGLCAQYEIPKRNWLRAVELLGQHGAALAFAVVAHHYGRGLVSSPGGYFHAMLERAAEGKLDLSRAYYGMRSRIGPKPR